MIKVCITNVKSVDNNEYICNNCHSNLLAGKLPVFSKANDMSFPEKPELVNLTSLEERMISPRIPFMQLRELPRGSQLSIHGNVVNVPADVNSTVNSLPRPLNELQTIPIKLKRRPACIQASFFVRKYKTIAGFKSSTVSGGEESVI